MPRKNDDNRHALLIFFSPFEPVRYKKGPNPDVRALHTSFWQKIKDTYRVFHGGTDLFEKKKANQPKLIALFAPLTAPGLVDYATLGVLRLIHYLFTKNAEFLLNTPLPKTGIKRNFLITAKVLLTIPFITLCITHFLVNGPVRMIASAALTIGCIFFTGIAHGISQRVKASKARKLAREELEEAYKPLPQPEEKDPTEEIFELTINPDRSINPKAIKDTAKIQRLQKQLPQFEEVIKIEEKENDNTAQVEFTVNENPYGDVTYCRLFDLNNADQQDKYNALKKKIDKHAEIDADVHKARYGNQTRPAIVVRPARAA